MSTQAPPYYEHRQYEVPPPPPPLEEKEVRRSAFRRILTVLSILMALALGLALGINLGDDSVELKRAGDTNDALDRRLSLVEGNNIDLRAEVTDLESDVSFFESETSRLSGRVEDLKGDLSDAKAAHAAQESTAPPPSGDIKSISATLSGPVCSRSVTSLWARATAGLSSLALSPTTVAGTASLVTSRSRHCSTLAPSS
jgi:hypothetical protein